MHTYTSILLVSSFLKEFIVTRVMAESRPERLSAAEALKLLQNISVDDSGSDGERNANENDSELCGNDTGLQSSHDEDSSDDVTDEDDSNEFPIKHKMILSQ